MQKWCKCLPPPYDFAKRCRFRIITLDRNLRITFLEGLKEDHVPGSGIAVRDAIGMPYGTVFPWVRQLDMARKMQAILSGSEVSCSRIN